MRIKLSSLLKCILLALAFSGPGSAFSNGEWASEIDLRAAYCWPVKKASRKDLDDYRKQYPFVGSESDKQMLSNLDAVGRFEEDKLSNYLTKRVASMNSKAIAQMTAARQSGEAASEIRGNITNYCFSELEKKKVDVLIWSDELKKCTEKSGVKGLRLDACGDLSWLPY